MTGALPVVQLRRSALAGLVALALVCLVGLVATPLLANGGIVRISGASVGPWLVTVYSSPTPLRTGEVDVSVLVQDSADQVLDVPVTVEAVPVALEGDAVAGPIRREATRAQATNKLFKAAKFDVDVPGEWEFVVRVGGGAGSGDAASDPAAVSFQATVARTTLLDRPYVLALLLLLPVGLTAWLLLGREE